MTSQIIFLFLSILGVVGLANTGLIYPYFFCTACPGHTGACPLWVLEVSSIELWLDPRVAIVNFFYLLGLLGVAGFLVGRGFCGWACPVGFLQEAYAKVRKTIPLDLPKAVSSIVVGGILISVPLGYPTIITGYLGLVGIVLAILGFFGLVVLYKSSILNLFLLLIGFSTLLASVMYLDYPEFPAFLGLMLCGVALMGLVYNHLASVKEGIKSLLGTLHLKPTQVKYVVLIMIPITSLALREMLFTDLDPVGGLIATLPTLLIDPSGWQSGTFFWPKMFLLVIFILFILLISRGWCKYLCPIGAMMAPTNKISITDININHDKCVKCKKCNKACPMNIDVMNYDRSLECVRCGRCVDACKFDAAHFNLLDKQIK